MYETKFIIVPGARLAYVIFDSTFTSLPHSGEKWDRSKFKSILLVSTILALSGG
jgi:hypothetical protein